MKKSLFQRIGRRLFRKKNHGQRAVIRQLPLVFTIQQAAVYIGVSKQRLYYLARKGRITALQAKPRSDLRFRIKDLDQWLENELEKRITELEDEKA